MAPLVAKEQQKPGAAMKSLPGISPQIIVNHEFVHGEGEVEGALVIDQPWPGMARTIFGDHERFVETYLKPNPGVYTTGDGAKRDADGDYWILGRMDDVLNVAGHRLGTAELESALVLHDKVAEAAVVGMPHAIKGQGICAFVSLMAGEAPSDALCKELVNLVRQEIGPIAIIDHLQFVSDLPKTRSGKIMRRILRKIAEGEQESIGDVSTLSNPDSVNLILKDFLMTNKV